MPRSASAQSPDEGIRSPVAGLTGGCELSIRVLGTELRSSTSAPNPSLHPVS